MTTICIIGLPRSGTTLLGRALASLPDARYVEEPNPAWRFRNWSRLGHEEFDASDATPEVVRFIRDILRPEDGSLLIEKTPANCLRTSFVRAVLPEARILFLRRDGTAVRQSIARKWLDGEDRNAERLNDSHPFRDLMTKFDKARYVHRSEVPLYVRGELAAHWTRLRRRRTIFWGPQMQGWEALARGTPEEAINGACTAMEATLQAGIDEDPGPHAVLSYEALMHDPKTTLTRAMSEIGCEDLDPSAAFAAKLTS